MTFSSAAWSTIDALVDAARAVDADERAAWLEARRLRPEVRAYVQAMAAGPVDLAPTRPAARAARSRPLAAARPDAPPPRPLPEGSFGAPRAEAHAHRRRGALLAGAAASLALLGLAAVRRRAVAAR